MQKQTGSTSNSGTHRPQWARQTPPPPRASAASTPIAGLMTRRVETVTPDTTLETLTDLMLSTGASSLPVVDEVGRVVGIVSKTDVLADHQLHGDTVDVHTARFPLRHGVSYAAAGVHVHEAVPTVAEVMTRSVLVLPDTACVAEACALMAVHHVHGVPVVDAEGKVVGMLESLDVLGWVAGLG